MNYLFGFVTISLIILIKVSVNFVGAEIKIPDHLRAPARILHRHCMKEANLSDEVIKRGSSGTLPDDREMQCYLDCLFTKTGMYDTNGNVHLAGIGQLLPDEIRAHFEDVIAKCETIPGTDKCNTAYLTVKCYKQENSEMDISKLFNVD